jgi:type III secretion protein R
MLFFPHNRISIQTILLVSGLLSCESWAKADSFDFGGGLLKDPFYLLFFLIGIALVPFLAIMTTSFAKIVVVLSITRQALGTAQTPPNIVIMSLAIVLTCFSMYPVGQEIYDAYDFQKISKDNGAQGLINIARSAETPIKNYLRRHTKEEDKQLFLSVMNSKAEKTAVLADDLIILAPAFLISELTLAFQIGFLVYLPFLVVDMTVANLLMALGMQMLSPTTISLPFKILLFVLVDGWRLLSEGLVKS